MRKRVKFRRFEKPKVRGELTGEEMHDLIRSFEQEDYEVDDYPPGHRGRWQAFSSWEERREMWNRHRVKFIARREPGRRPGGFWDYEGPPGLRDAALEDIKANCVFSPAQAELATQHGRWHVADIAARDELDRRRRAWLLAHPAQLRPGEAEAMAERERRLAERNRPIA